MENNKVTLKSALVNCGLTQKEAAKILGVSVDTLSKYERGLSFPDVPIIKHIEKLYQVPYSGIIFNPHITV